MNSFRLTEDFVIKARFRRHVGNLSRKRNAEHGNLCKSRRAHSGAHTRGVASLTRDNQPLAFGLRLAIARS